MKHNRINIGRRDFLKAGSLAVVSAAIAGNAGNAAAQAAAAQTAKLDENDAQAKNFGYKHDATKVDKAKFPKYVAGQTCANCTLYQGKPTDPWAGCPIFPGKQVAGKGWCSAYVKKA